MRTKPCRPFSLVRRITALVVGVSVVSLALQIALLVAIVPAMGDELAMHIASQVRSVSVALRSVRPENRQSVADAVSSVRMRISTIPPVAAGRSTPAREEAPAGFIEKVEATLGRKVDSAVSFDANDKPWLHLGVTVDGQTWWLSFLTLRPSLLWGLLPVLLIASAGVAALVLGVRMVTRPMSRLAQDLLARRYELRQIDEPPDVSVELQRVIRSFNSLVHAVELSAESRRNLLAGVSHDLRTPLARLRLRVETECSDEVTQKMEADFLAIGRIIDQFLAYAQGQSGVTIGEMHPIVDLVEAVVSQYRAEGADVSFAWAYDGLLQVPDLGVQRALVNLIDNALDHGRAPVELELWAEDAELLVVVYDHGPGIEQHEVENAFRPFVRSGPSSAHGGHCGLGLAIVAQVAEQLGGRTLSRGFDGKRSGMGIALPL